MRETSANTAKTGHKIDPHNIKILATEDHTTQRRLKEAKATKQGNLRWIGTRDLTFRLFIILSWDYVTPRSWDLVCQLNVIADEVRVIGAKYSNF